MASKKAVSAALLVALAILCAVNVVTAADRDVEIADSAVRDDSENSAYGSDGEEEEDDDDKTMVADTEDYINDFDDDDMTQDGPEDSDFRRRMIEESDRQERFAEYCRDRPAAPADGSCSPASINANMLPDFQFVECTKPVELPLPAPVTLTTKEEPARSVTIDRLVGRTLPTTVSLYKGLASLPESVPIVYDGHKQRWFTHGNGAKVYDRIGDGCLPAQFHASRDMFFLDLMNRENILAIVGLMNKLTLEDVLPFFESGYEGGKGGMSPDMNVDELKTKWAAKDGPSWIPFAMYALRTIRSYNMGETLATNYISQLFLSSVGFHSFNKNIPYYPLDDMFNDRNNLRRASVYSLDFPAFYGMTVALRKAGLGNVGGFYMNPIPNFGSEIMFCDGYEAVQDAENVRLMHDFLNIPLSETNSDGDGVVEDVVGGADEEEEPAAVATDAVAPDGLGEDTAMPQAKVGDQLAHAGLRGNDKF